MSISIEAGVVLSFFSGGAYFSSQSVAATMIKTFVRNFLTWIRIGQLPFIKEKINALI